MSLKNLSEKEKELVRLNEKLNENKLKLQNDYVTKGHFTDLLCFYFRKK